MITFVSKTPSALTLERMDTVRVEKSIVFPVGVPVDLAAPGHEIAVTWAGVAGANDVEVDSAQLTLMQDAVEETVPDLPVTGGTVTIPAGRRVASLRMGDLRGPASETISGTGDLGTRRVVVAVSPAGGPFGAPLYAVPNVPARGVFPATFTGASFQNKVLTLPAVAARKVQISVIDNFPEDAAGQNITLASVEGRLLTFPSGITLTDEEGTTVWARPNEMGAGEAAAVDLRHAIENVLKKKAKSGAPLATTLRLQGTGRVRMAFSGAHGAVLRTVPGVIATELAGDPVVLAVPSPPLAGVAPSRAVADVTVRYHGMRILETVSDSDVPSQAGGVSGVVVSGDAVLRALPPQGLDGFTVAKIGIVGRAPVECELVVELVDVTSGTPAGAVATPAARVLPASTLVETIWLDVPAHAPIGVPVAVSVRTNHGRFLWAAAPDPLLRVAVLDPDPGGRPVRIGGRTIVTVTAPKEVHAPGVSIAGAAFASVSPLVESALFATVDVSDLRLEYDR